VAVLNIYFLINDKTIRPIPNSSTFSVTWSDYSELSCSGAAKEGLQTGVKKILSSLVELNLEIPKSINLIDSYLSLYKIFWRVTSLWIIYYSCKNFMQSNNDIIIFLIILPNFLKNRNILWKR